MTKGSEKLSQVLLVRVRPSDRRALLDRAAALRTTPSRLLRDALQRAIRPRR